MGCNGNAKCGLLGKTPDWKQPQFDVLAGLDAKDPFGYSSRKDFEADAKTVSKYDIATLIRMDIDKAVRDGVKDAQKFSLGIGERVLLTAAGADYIKKLRGETWNLRKFFGNDAAISPEKIGEKMIRPIDGMLPYGPGIKGVTGPDFVVDRDEVKFYSASNSDSVFTRLEEKPTQR